MKINVPGDIFGWFSVGPEIVTTAEAHVFTCNHEPAYQSYLLRLSHQEAEGRKSAAPEWQPSNATLELPNIRATAAATSILYPARYLSDSLSGNSDHLVLSEYYGVLDARYIVPVSAIYRRRGAISFEDLLKLPSEIVRISPFWRHLGLLLRLEAALTASGLVAFGEWKERWRHLINGSRLGEDLLSSFPAGSSGRLAAQITAIVSDRELGVGPTFEESAIMRLITAFAVGRLTEQQVAATLSCPFFRLNITAHDLRYAIALTELIQQQRDWLRQSPVKLLGPSVLLLPTIMNSLLMQPVMFPKDSSAFEQCSQPDEAMVARFSLFLQDPERIAREYLALQKT